MLLLIIISPVQTVLVVFISPLQNARALVSTKATYGTSVDAVQAVLDDGKICVMDLEQGGSVVEYFPSPQSNECMPSILCTCFLLGSKLLPIYKGPGSYLKNQLSLSCLFSWGKRNLVSQTSPPKKAATTENLKKKKKKRSEKPPEMSRQL